MSFSSYVYYVKPSSKAATGALMNGLALALVKDPAPATIMVDEIPVSGVYKVPERVLSHLRDSAHALEVVVYFEYPGQGVRRFDSYERIVEQAREQRAAA